MNYKRVYDDICIRGLNVREGEYFEKHRILPGCMGGEYVDGNVSILTAREHYIAHWLLCKIHPSNRKLVYAFNNMCRKGENQLRVISSVAFAAARKLFSENHPMKDPAIRAKVSKSHLERGKRVREERAEARPRCIGCGSKVYRAENNYCNQECYHKHKDQSWNTAEHKKKLSELHVERIDNLSDDEKEARLAKSLHSGKVDHVARGKAISAGKKGKKTNQVEIMGKRFAAMSDEELEKYLDSVSSRVHTRSRKYRERWLKS